MPWYDDDLLDGDDAWSTPDDEQDDGADDDGTVPCPACGELMFEDSPRCPSCGEYVSASTAAATARPTWIVVTVLVCLAVALWWVAGGLW
jgi:uncharacterized protein (DUF983 family)